MNPREKKMAVLIAGLGVLFAGYYLWSSIDGAFQQRRNRLNAVTKQRREQVTIQQRASKDTRELNAMLARALPSDREKARSLYEQWLLNLTEQCEFSDPSVRPLDRRVRSDAFEQHSFQLEGKASLAQVTQFLTNFYKANDLHRISQLTLTPIKDSRQLDIVCWVDALTLPGSKRIAVGDQNSSKVTAETLAQAERSIVQRGMFFPANNPPQLEAIGKQRLTLGSSMQVTAKVTDPDSWDELKFQLGEGAPPDVKLDVTGRGEARIQWRPEATGSFVVPLEVVDTGYPPRNAQATIEVTVVDPPPPTPQRNEEDEPEFHLGHSYLVATTQGVDGRREAWFEVRTTGDRPKVAEGELLRVGRFRGTVISIATDYVDLLREKDNKSIRVRIGQNVESAAIVETAAPTTTTPAATDAPESPAGSEQSAEPGVPVAVDPTPAPAG